MRSTSWLFVCIVEWRFVLVWMLKLRLSMVGRAPCPMRRLMTNMLLRKSASESFTVKKSNNNDLATWSEFQGLTCHMINDSSSLITWACTTLLRSSYLVITSLLSLHVLSNYSPLQYELTQNNTKKNNPSFRPTSLHSMVLDNASKAND